MRCEENEITGFLRQDTSRLNARGLEISGRHFKSPAFLHYPICLLSFSLFQRLPVFVSHAYSLTSLPPPTFLSNRYYITWHDGMNRTNLFIPLSPILFQCHARCIKRANPQVHLNTHRWLLGGDNRGKRWDRARKLPRVDKRKEFKMFRNEEHGTRQGQETNSELVYSVWSPFLQTPQHHIDLRPLLC